jgi:hypothetical protein
MTTRQVLQMVRCLGPRWVAYRAIYAFRQKTGLLRRRFPTTLGDSAALSTYVKPGVPSDPEKFKSSLESRLGRFFFSLGRTPSADTLSRCMGDAACTRTLQVADDFARGRFLYYSDATHDLGWPPDWHLNPFTGARHRADLHWCDYPTFHPDLGDVKDVWEPSRFAAAHWLARAYVLTGDEQYPNAFWTLFETWAAQNPPNLGPNWKCGQETAIRVFAWCIALHVFWRSPETTGRRVAHMAALLAVQADRIYHNINFAVSQKNNHSMSEAVGLLTVGLLFPFFRDADRWERRGRIVLEADARRQIYDDGSFVQHSMNYHRVMLHDMMWAVRLADLNDRPLSAELKHRVGLATVYLDNMIDPVSGCVPNYGANDGALVLPLHACDYTDYRPTLQAAALLTRGRRALEPGPWDETAIWLFGEDALKSGPVTPQRESRRFDAGGYYTLRARDTWAMIRCHTYHDRPAHVDMLHLDLWHRGINVLSDSGSYKYYTPDNPALGKFFKDIAAHNTIELDSRGPLEMASRFLWLPWPKARCLEHNASRFIGEHDAYARAPWHVTHRRSVEQHDDDTWTVTDDLLGCGRRHVCLRWHFVPGQAELKQNTCTVTHANGIVRVQVDTPPGAQLTLDVGRCDETAFGGWMSRYYGRLEPRPALIVEGDFDLPARLVSRITFPG